MARYRTGPHQGRDNPWVASVQLNNKVYWLGSFKNKTTAEAIENAFRESLVQIRMEADELWRMQFSPNMWDGYPL